MAEKSESIIVSWGIICRESIKIRTYTPLQELVTGADFLNITKINPARLCFFVNGKLADDDLLLVPGDLIQIERKAHEKGAISACEFLEKLQRISGLKFIEHKESHDIWETEQGYTVKFPRHADDLTIEALQAILTQAGIQTDINEFVSTLSEYT